MILGMPLSSQETKSSVFLGCIAWEKGFRCCVDVPHCFVLLQRAVVVSYDFNACLTKAEFLNTCSNPVFSRYNLVKITSRLNSLKRSVTEVESWQSAD